MIGPAQAAMLIALAGPAAAQGLAPPGSQSRAPIEIVADDGIEWQQKSQLYIARGHARATQGDSTIYADVLTAHYQSGEGKPSDITRIDADGNVRLASPSGTATGAKAVYDVSKGILVLTGNPRLVTDTDRIAARDSLEYWRDRAIVVARGNATATRADKRLAANVLVGHMGRGADGKEKIVRIDAFDDVSIVTGSEVVRSAKGAYDVESGIATLEGAVKITRGETQLNGDRAEVDLNSGRSRLLSGPGGPVRGVIVPGREPGRAR
jgi:lipopolysaccharide export system protein LptA